MPNASEFFVNLSEFCENKSNRDGIAVPVVFLWVNILQIGIYRAVLARSYDSPLAKL
jgi:hypothetical protein